MSIFSIPDCPRLSKYDGMGMAGAGMIYAEKERKRREQEEVERNSNTSDNLDKDYWNAYMDGYRACMQETKDIFGYVRINKGTRKKIEKEMNENLDNAIEDIKDILGIV
jgi:hypothetical protein